MDYTLAAKLSIASAAWAWSVFSTSSNWIATLIATAFVVRYFVSVEFTKILQTFVWTLCGIFFREIVPVNMDRVPSSGPVIFVCCPHSNQLADPVVVLSTLYSKRPFSFVVASATLRRRVAGSIAKLFEPIGVERPQDCTFRGKGTISTKFENGSWYICGSNGTKLKDQLHHGDVVRVALRNTESNMVLKCQATVDQVDQSLNQVLMKTEFKAKVELGSGNALKSITFKDEKFQVVPVIDHVRMFSNVYEKLGNNGCIGIFPEGGSHDQPKMLPFKAGVVKMALGTVTTHSHTLQTLRIVPVGLSYSNKHRFRSRAAISFGEPIQVPCGMAQQYAKGTEAEKRATQDELLRIVRSGCEKITLQADSNEHLLNFPLLHSIHAHDGTKVKYPIQNKIAFAQTLCNDFERVKDLEQVVRVMSATSTLRKTLKKLRIRDHMLGEIVTTSKWEALVHLLATIGKMALMFMIYLPIATLSMPLYVLVEVMAHRQARKAKENSVVKITGEDVLASAKVVLFLTFYPLVHLTYAACTLYFAPQHLVAQFILSPVFLYIAITRGIERFQGYRRAYMLNWTVLFHRKQVEQILEQRMAIKEMLYDLCREDGEVHWGKA